MCRKPFSFSLVELVVVVVIIGVISAIAVPRISRGAKGASEAALQGNLRNLRSAIDTYAAEHRGTWPGADGLQATLIAQLTMKTNDAGNTGTAVGVHVFGPYLRSGFASVPVGPTSGAAGVVMTDQADLTLDIDEGDNSIGWVYNYETGDIIANTDDLDETGVGYGTY